jgi:hypothetical protein
LRLAALKLSLQHQRSSVAHPRVDQPPPQSQQGRRGMPRQWGAHLSPLQSPPPATAVQRPTSRKRAGSSRGGGEGVGAAGMRRLQRELAQERAAREAAEQAAAELSMLLEHTTSRLEASVSSASFHGGGGAHVVAAAERGEGEGLAPQQSAAAAATVLRHERSRLELAEAQLDAEAAAHRSTHVRLEEAEAAVAELVERLRASQEDLLRARRGEQRLREHVSELEDTLRAGVAEHAEQSRALAGERSRGQADAL